MLGQELIAAGTKDKDPEKLALTYIQSGWALIGAYISLGERASIGITMVTGLELIWHFKMCHTWLKMISEFWHNLETLHVQVQGLFLPRVSIFLL